MKIVVLAGGLSDERNVSLSSGCKVCAALREIGYSGTFNLETDGAVCMYPAELAEDAMVFLEKIGRYFINHYRL